jgi:hypothetical protein
MKEASDIAENLLTELSMSEADKEKFRELCKSLN